MNRDQIIADARLAANSLFVSAVSLVPQHFDFDRSGESYDFNYKWQSFEAVTCDDCGQTIVSPEHHGFVDGEGNAVDIPASLIERRDEEELEEWAEEQGFERCPNGELDAGELGAEGPMMNFRYELPDHRKYDASDALVIAHLNLCLVEIDDRWYLALTGGGMDFSWEICEAYVRLGFLPPVHFSLPGMAGIELTPKTALIVAAVERANQAVAGWADRNAERAAELFTELPDPKA